MLWQESFAALLPTELVSSQQRQDRIEYGVVVTSNCLFVAVFYWYNASKERRCLSSLAIGN